MKKTITFIAALVTIIVGAITIYQFYKPIEKTQPQRSLLEKLEGVYALHSWVPVNRQMELGVDVIKGTLKVRSDGMFDWSVELVQKPVPNPGKVRMTARGKFFKSTMIVKGIQGGEFNNTHHLDARWGQVSSSVGLAIRGWQTGKPEDSFQISIDERSNGEILLDMKNSRCIYTWKK